MFVSHVPYVVITGAQSIFCDILPLLQPVSTYICSATDQSKEFLPDLQTTGFCLRKVHALLIQWTPPQMFLTAALWKVTLKKLIFCRNVHKSCLFNVKWSLQICWGNRQTISSCGLLAWMLHTYNYGDKSKPSVVALGWLCQPAGSRTQKTTPISLTVSELDLNRPTYNLDCHVGLAMIKAMLVTRCSP